MDILLVRHGVPACDRHTRIRARDFGRWVQQYDEAPLELNSIPPAELRARAATVRCICTSTLRRSIDSAALLAPHRQPVRNALFDEAGIPTSFNVPIALRPAFWDGVARTAWVLGWSRDAETLRTSRKRAERAAEYLITLARRHDSVMLVGHGMLNTLIKRALRKRGWTGSGPPRKHWGLVALRHTKNAGY